MPTTNDLMLAVLALDAYNHGYNPGMPGVSGSQIGDATLKFDSAELPTTQNGQAAGFYATTYNWNGKTVISYRGTTFELGINTARDVINGWVLSAGYAAASQPQLALDFYTSVTGQPVFGGTTTSGVILTGHPYRGHWSDP